MSLLQKSGGKCRILVLLLLIQCLTGAAATLTAFSTQSNWTWIGGPKTYDNTGNYGTKGLAAATNWPSARQFATVAINGKTGTLYMFGGYGPLALNDLWAWDSASGFWTWMSGSSTTEQPPVFGLLGVPASTNVPGARFGHAMTIDPNSGSLYLFGGDPAIFGRVWNDLWEWNPSTTYWTWVAGTTTQMSPGVFGIQKIESATNVPPGRLHHSMVFDSETNSLIIFGGCAGSFDVRLNDLWRWNSKTKKWAWMAGSSQHNGASIGLIGDESTGNTPSARFAHTMALNSASSSAFIFGGSTGSGWGWLSNEVWRWNVKTQMWTLVSAGGAQVSYGIQGVASSSNMISARYGHSMNIDAASGVVLIFGGYDIVVNNNFTGDIHDPLHDRLLLSGGDITNHYNDFWTWDPQTNFWTWISGGSSRDAQESYGIQGESSASNLPGPRAWPSACIDPTSNVLYVFGGMKCKHLFSIEKNSQATGLGSMNNNPCGSRPQIQSDLWRMSSPKSCPSGQQMLNEECVEVPNDVSNCNDALDESNAPDSTTLAASAPTTSPIVPLNEPVIPVNQNSGTKGGVDFSTWFYPSLFAMIAVGCLSMWLYVSTRQRTKNSEAELGQQTVQKTSSSNAVATDPASVISTPEFSPKGFVSVSFHAGSPADRTQMRRTSRASIELV